MLVTSRLVAGHSPAGDCLVTTPEVPASSWLWTGRCGGGWYGAGLYGGEDLTVEDSRMVQRNHMTLTIQLLIWSMRWN